MNAPDQEPFKATSIEAQSSKADAAGRRHEDKSALAIKAKLFLAFGGMALLTAAASGVAWYAFANIDRSVTRITAKSIAGMAVSLRLAEKSAEITATAPTLIASRNEDDRPRQHKRVVKKLKYVSAMNDSVKATGAAAGSLDNLIAIEGKIASELRVLDSAVEQRLRLSAQREGVAADLAVAHAKLQEVLEPLVDDAS